MERYASTLAVTAACIALLLTAHHRIVNQRETVGAGPVGQRVTAAARPAATSSTAWVEPPAKFATTSAAPMAMRERLVLAEAAPASEPVVAATAAKVLPAVTPTRHAALRPEHAKHAGRNADARKLDQARERRMRIAAHAVPGDTHGGRTTAQAAPAEKRIDPIGDLMRSLGIGGEV